MLLLHGLQSTCTHVCLPERPWPLTYRIRGVVVRIRGVVVRIRGVVVRIRGVVFRIRGVVLK